MCGGDICLFFVLCWANRWLYNLRVIGLGLGCIILSKTCRICLQLQQFLGDGLFMRDLLRTKRNIVRWVLDSIDLKVVVELGTCQIYICHHVSHAICFLLTPHLTRQQEVAHWRICPFFSASDVDFDVAVAWWGLVEVWRAEGGRTIYLYSPLFRRPFDAHNTRQSYCSWF